MQLLYEFRKLFDGGEDKLLANFAKLSMPASEEDKLKFLTDAEVNFSPIKQLETLISVYPVSMLYLTIIMLNKSNLLLLC